MFRPLLILTLLLVADNTLFAQSLLEIRDQETAAIVNTPTAIPNEWKQLPNTKVQIFVDGNLMILESKLGITGNQFLGWVVQKFGNGASVNGLHELVGACDRFRVGSSAIKIESLLGDPKSETELPKMFYCRLFYSPNRIAERTSIIQAFLAQRQIGSNEHFINRASSVFPLTRGKDSSLWCSFDKDDSFVVGTPAFFAHKQKRFTVELKEMFDNKSAAYGLGLYADLKGQTKILDRVEVEALGKDDLLRLDIGGASLDLVETQLAGIVDVAQSNSEMLASQVQLTAGITEETSRATVELLKSIELTRSAKGLELSTPKSETENLKTLLQGLFESTGQKRTYELRSWKIKDSKQSFAARLIEVAGNQVKLSKEDGSAFSTELEKLSTADQEYIVDSLQLEQLKK